MILEFSWLPPEINSARIFAGAGPGPLHRAALAWQSLAADLGGSASSFHCVIADLVGGPWAGPSSVAMAAAAVPYVGWLSTAAGQAEVAAGQALAAATAFEAALTATVHPAAVTANRVSFMTLIATNFLGQNTPSIAAAEFDYVEMWAQDVAAMVGYHGGATAVAATLAPFEMPPVDLAQIGATVSAAMAPVTGLLAPVTDTFMAAAPSVVSGVQSMVSGLPVQSLMSVAQMAATPASMLMGPLMQMGQSTSTGMTGLADAAATGLVDAPKLAADISPAAKGFGGGGLGAGMSAGLGDARMVGPMSVPPTWQGSMPKAMGSSALTGLGANAAEMAQMAQPAGSGGMPMMPMPMGGGGAGAGMPGGMMGRGGANPHVVQNRPSVIPRAGVG